MPNSTAKSGANIASAMGADAAYYNPANMAWMDKGAVMEGAVSYIHLPAIDYADSRSSDYNGESEKEHFFIPTMFMVSPEYGNFRFGLATVSPYGLAKRWKTGYAKTFAQEFSLKTGEFNPSVSYKVNDSFSFAAGARVIYAEAKVRSDGTVAVSEAAGEVPGMATSATRYMEGDTLEAGYNLALSIRPDDKTTFAITYRSKIDLGLEADAGEVILSTTTVGTTAPVVGATLASATVDNTGANVSVPAPAVLSISASHTYDKLTVDLTYDRTYWSKYKTLDFNYDNPLGNAVLIGAFDLPKAKNWEDADCFRLGFTYVANENWTYMAGIAYDETPVPDATLGFELPGSDAYLFSLGFRHKLDEQTEIAVGYLYDYKKSRTVVNDKINGEFTDAAAHLVTIGMSYKF